MELLTVTPPVVMDTILPLSDAARMYADVCELSGMLRTLPIESARDVNVPAAGVVPPTTVLLIPLVKVTFWLASIDKAATPLVAIAAVVPVGKYKPVLELVVLLSAGADAEPSGVCMPVVPEIRTGIMKPPQW
jgi:hypothetical protein